MEEALSEVGLRFKCAEDFREAGHSTSGEGKTDESRRVAKVLERVYLCG